MLKNSRLRTIVSWLVLNGKYAAIYVCLVSIGSGCATSQSRIDTLSNSIVELESDLARLEEKLRVAERQLKSTDETLAYIGSSEGRETFKGGQCLLPRNLSTQPNQCSSREIAEEYVAAVCTFVTACVKAGGELFESNGSGILNYVKDAFVNSAATTGCSAAVGMSVSSTDLLAAIGSAGFNKKLDDIISAGYSAYSCINTLAGSCRNEYRAWEAWPGEALQRCQSTTRRMRNTGISLDSLRQKVVAEKSIVRGFQAKHSELKTQISELKSARDVEKAKIAPRKAGEVVISF